MSKVKNKSEAEIKRGSFFNHPLSFCQLFSSFSFFLFLYRFRYTIYPDTKIDTNNTPEMKTNKSDNISKYRGYIRPTCTSRLACHKDIRPFSTS